MLGKCHVWVSWEESGKECFPLGAKNCCPSFFFPLFFLTPLHPRNSIHTMFRPFLARAIPTQTIAKRALSTGIPKVLTDTHTHGLFFVVVQPGDLISSRKSNVFSSEPYMQMLNACSSSSRTFWRNRNQTQQIQSHIRSLFSGETNIGGTTPSAVYHVSLPGFLHSLSNSYMHLHMMLNWYL